MIEQIFIAVTELIAVFLIQSKNENHAKWASVFGLLGQPFWFYASYKANQFGQFSLCFFFTAAWAKSYYEHWIKAKPSITKDGYYMLICDAVDKIGENTMLDYKDYVKRVSKEALDIQTTSR